MSGFPSKKYTIWALVLLLFYFAGCFTFSGPAPLNLDYLDAVQAVSVIRPFEYFNYTAVEKEIVQPEEIENLTETIKHGSIKGIYKPGDSRFSELGFPDYYVDFLLGELEVRSFYWKERYILMPASLEAEKKGESYLLKLEKDFFE